MRLRGVELRDIANDPGESAPVTDRPGIVERRLKTLKQYKKDAIGPMKNTDDEEAP